MNFHKKPLKTEIYSKAFPRRRKRKMIWNVFWKFKKLNYAKIWVYAILWMSFIICVWGIIIYTKYIKPLPSIKELENLNIAEASTIYDQDWNELYKVFKEKRTYVELGEMSENMVHAIVAGEDKTFFQNNWVDVKRMIWAFVYYILWKTDKVEGTSTISQQLIRNTLIWNERRLERKVKEMYLSYKLNTWISKEKILELYLNKISFWHNAFWVEEASQTFFGKSTKDIDVFQAAVLAWLPKWPSYYSPYNHPDRIVWYPYIYEEKQLSDEVTEDEVLNEKIITQKDIESHVQLVEALKSNLSSLTGKRLSSNSILICGLNKSHLKTDVAVDKDGCLVIEYSKLLNLLNTLKIDQETMSIEYQTGRKDFILQRMLEDDYITFDDYKNAVIEWIGYEFNPYIEKIDHPYFVMYVKDYIEKKYGTGMLEQAWLKIYTTLNPEFQNKAEELVLDYSTKYKTSIDADNAALISIDNRTGHIVAMVGWRDYFDTENRGNVNIITSNLQPGSSFKPFVYALAMDKQQLWTRSPIYDVPTDFWSYKPKNFDGKFMWKMTVASALNHSRNIPAIKMYFYAGQEPAIKKMMSDFWVTWLNKEEWYYWPPMALWTIEIKPLELAGAYSVFANKWYKKDVTPILKIIDSKWLVIEDNSHDDEKKWTQVFDEWSAFLISSILSDTSARPDTWNKFLTLNDRPVAAKTGTSTKQYTKSNGEKIIMPRNLWTAWYTPQYTTIAWVGNTDGSEVSLKWDWLQSAWPIWRDFMNFIHKWEPVKNWEKPSNIKSVPVSQISWFLVWENFPSEYSNDSLFKNIPRTYDENFFLEKVDVLCNGKVTEKTPIAAQQEIFWVKFISFESDQQWGRWQPSIENWYKNEWGCQSVFGDKNNFICWISADTQVACERPSVNPNIEIAARFTDESALVNGSNYIELAYRWENPIQKIEIFLWENKIDDIIFDNIKKEWSFKWSFFIPQWYYWDYTMKIAAVDNQFYAWEQTKNVSIVQSDKNNPEVHIITPNTQTYYANENEILQISGEVIDQSEIRAVNIYLNEKAIKLWIKERNFSYDLDIWKLDVWDYTVKIEAVDNTFNIGSASFKLVKPLSEEWI